MAGVRIVVAEPSALIRSVLRLAGSDGAYDVAADAADLTALRATGPHRDINAAVIGDGGGSRAILDDVRRLTDAGMPTLVLSDERAPEALTALLDLGPAGLLSYDVSPQRLRDAIVDVALGGSVLDAPAAAVVLSQWRWFRSQSRSSRSGRHALTDREHQILTALADGLSTKAIARELGIAVKTVENHKIRLFDKLGVSTQAEAVSSAIGNGLLTGRGNERR